MLQQIFFEEKHFMISVSQAKRNPSDRVKVLPQNRNK